MSKFIPPTSGGRFELQKSGGLKQVEEPTQEVKKTAPAPSDAPSKGKEA